MRASWTLRTLAMAALFAVTACGDDESSTGGVQGGQAEGGQGGQGAGGDASGGGGESPVEPALEGARAPTEFEIRIQFAGLTEAPSLAASAYEVRASSAVLVVQAVSFDEVSKEVVLTTEKQPLGAELVLTLNLPESSLDGETASFLGADTAQFWAVDYEDNFSFFQVKGTRHAMGEHVVLYVTDDVDGANDTDETLAFFDDKIVPIESELFHSIPDLDQNGRVVILGLDGKGYYGGYFSGINSYRQSELPPEYKSNEMEILFVSVPDNGNRWAPAEVVAHEFFHLLYNEEHGFGVADGTWHNEGLATCATAIVTGSPNQFAIQTYLGSTQVQAGKSMVIWDYSNYDQYALSYMFLTYAAGQLGGIPGFQDLFKESGAPSDVSNLFEQRLGKNFSEMQLSFMAAAWVDAESGPLGFGGLIGLNGARPLVYSGGSANLPTYGGVFLQGAPNAVPSGAGPDVIHLGINSNNELDALSPFDTANGIVIALNGLQNSATSATEPSGVVLPAEVEPMAAQVSWESLRRLRMHPPPMSLTNREALLKWRRNAHGF